jgi:uncharacterized membrane protein YdjX (TVP38/TMEM64 family)
MSQAPPQRPSASCGLRLGRPLLVLAILGAVAALGASGWADQLRWEQLSQRREQLHQLVADYPLGAAVLFFLVEVVAVALALPVATVLSVAAGVLFGRWWGTVLVSFASTLGATLAFLASRYLLRQTVRAWVPARWLARIDQGIQREGALFLLTLRLVPVVPFVVINSGMGLTRLPVGTFWWVSQVGMLPGTFIYVNAGATAGQIEAPADLLTWPVVLSLAGLALLPWLARWLVGRLTPSAARTAELTADTTTDPTAAPSAAPSAARTAELTAVPTAEPSPTSSAAEPHSDVTGN